jgi:hypothetical protein
MTGIKVKGSRNLIQAQLGNQSKTSVAQARTMGFHKEDPYMNNITLDRVLTVDKTNKSV